MSKLSLVLPFLMVIGCGSGVVDMPSGGRPADTSSTGEDDITSPLPQVHIERSGNGSVVESVASSEQYMQWFAVPEQGWVFDRWEFVGTTIGQNDTVLTYDGGFFRENPLELDERSDGILTAIFVEDVAAPVNSVRVFQESSWLVLAASANSAITATAFAVSERHLATNAHVVEAIETILGEPDGIVGVFQHESGLGREIVRVWTHPEYETNALQPTPDVGILLTSEDVPVFVTTPRSGTTPVVDVLDPVTLCGFPGSTTVLIDLPGALDNREFHPRASCLSGNVSAIRPLQASDSLTQANGRLIQYDIATEPGLSGSAVFNESGEVIGIHALGLSQDAEQNVAIRSDVLVEMLGWIERGAISGVLLSDIQPNPSPPIVAAPCNSTCSLCWVGTSSEGQCPLEWDGDGVCDCGCQFIDDDCGDRPLLGGLAHLAILGVPTGYGCGSICVRFPSTGSTYCDSDCDGWHDSVEIDFGYDPCSPFSPPYAPSFPSTVCADIFGPQTARLSPETQYQRIHHLQSSLMKQ